MSDIMSNNEDNVISIGGWILIFILQSIPIVGFIMMIIWALDTSNRTRANYARAFFVIMAIVFLLAFLVGLIVAGLAAHGA